EQVPPDRQHPDNLTTYGIGEVILDALDRGCTSFIIGIGGSATNDGGMGMLQALGMRAYDSNGDVLSIFGGSIKQVQYIELAGLDERLTQVEIKVATDVDNPLCGENGATAVYGPQKGIASEQIKQYDS